MGSVVRNVSSFWSSTRHSLTEKVSHADMSAFLSNTWKSAIQVVHDCKSRINTNNTPSNVRGGHTSAEVFSTSGRQAQETEADPMRSYEMDGVGSGSGSGSGSESVNASVNRLKNWNVIAERVSNYVKPLTEIDLKAHVSWIQSSIASIPTSAVLPDLFAKDGSRNSVMDRIFQNVGHISNSSSSVGIGQKDQTGLDGIVDSFRTHMSTLKSSMTGPLAPVDGIVRNLHRLYSGVTSEHLHAVRDLPDLVNGGDLLVFVGKRALVLDSFYSYISPHLKRIHAEHVGIKIVIVPEPGDSKVKSVIFDFVPKGDGDFSKFTDSESLIQKNKVEFEEWAFVGASQRSLREVHTFNRKYARLQEYSLGKSDCRDYASALVQFLTAEKLAPEHVAGYINKAKSLQQRDPEAWQSAVASQVVRQQSLQKSRVAA
eukprot:ANDGO_06790.mRNA.1 hypothetical protein